VRLNEKKGVAVFRIPISPNRPHYLMSENKKLSFVRVEDRSVQASKEVWEVIKKSSLPKDTIFTYGKKEEVLMKLLAEKERITLKEFASVAQLPTKLASSTLVRLVVANVLCIHPQEGDDFFTLKE
jgi:hypothetical protein